MDTQTRVIPGGLVPGLDSACCSVGGGTPSWRSGASPSPTPRTAAQNPNTPLPAPNNVVPRSLTERESQLVKHLSRLQFFLATAPTRWTGNDDNVSSMPTAAPARHPNLNRFPLLNGEYVSCVFWNGLYHITGTDIVRALVFRFEAFSRPVQNMKKFEEGVFSDLRNLKPGTDACLEEPKTQKKQKVFYWFSVPHDRLFLDALERDLKREKANTEPTTAVLGEPARSFRYDPTRGLYEQFAGKQPGLEPSEDPNSPASSQPDLAEPTPGSAYGSQGPMSSTKETEDFDVLPARLTPPADDEHRSAGGDDAVYAESTSSVLFSRSLLKGSPSYKQRRKKAIRGKRQSRASTAGTQYDSANEESGSENDMVRFPTYSTPFGNDNPTQRGDCIDPQLHLLTSHHNVQLQSRLPLLSPSHICDPPAWSQPVNRDSAAFDPRTSSGVSSPMDHDVKPDDIHAVTPPIPAQQGLVGKGFSCPLLSCGRLFKRLEHLKRHVRTHTQERPYECTRCSKRFSRSDNLTQHVKTHEKADRGERMKTEASENTEDEVVRYLEAEVDAMAAREMRTFGLAGDGSGLAEGYPVRHVMNKSHLSRSFETQLQVYMSPGQQGGITPHFGTQDTPGWSSALEQSWAGGRDGAHPPPMDQLRSNLLKRHRSMTPNITSSRSANPSTMSARYHPYALPPLAAIPHGSAPMHRSSSVDSFQVPHRMTAAPTSQLLPEHLNPPARSNSIFRQQPTARDYLFQSQESGDPASIFPAMGLVNAIQNKPTDAVAEASGFAEWANGSV